jgi:cyclopropane fatty-acyl-phospholipid synthase-like methyltransferase
MSGNETKTGSALRRPWQNHLAHGFYELSYRFGKPRWDRTDRHREIEQIVAGGAPGRALDLGCGTGATATHLAQRGWEVVGIDFVPEAIAKADERALRAGVSATFRVGDVTRLHEIGLTGPFDLLIDVGCFHAISEELRSDYAAEVAAQSRSGADLYIAGISEAPHAWRILGARGVNVEDLRRYFDDSFEVAEHMPIGSMGRKHEFVLCHLIRR